MKKIIALSALMAALASANAMAVDSSLTFNGAVTSGTCTMNSADATKTLTIPDISAASLAANSGSFGYQVANGTVNFTGCPGSVSSVKVVNITNSGTPVNGDAKNYFPASGTVTGVALTFSLGTAGNALAIDGSTLNYSVNTSNGAASIPIYSGVRAAKAVQSSLAAPTAGTYNSAFTLTFAWS